MSKIQDPKTGAKPAKASGKHAGKAPAKTAEKSPLDEKPKAQETQARAGWRSARPAAGRAPATGKKSDGFEKRQPPKPALAAPGGASPSGGAMVKAKDPGVLFRERPPADRGDATPEDLELAAAVEQTRELLKPVRGIQRIGPGQNEHGQPVVLIAAQDGFTDASLRAIPGRVGRFDTLLTLPYELLPLPPGESRTSV